MKSCWYRSLIAHLVFPLSILVLFTLVPSPANAADTWGIKNSGSAWGQGQEGFAIDGACYGMVVAARTYHELKLDKIRPFSDVTTPKPSISGGAQSKQLFIEQFAALAQNYALRNRRSDKELYSLPADPAAVDRSLQSSGISADKPQILILTNHAAVAADPSAKLIGHAVLVQDREEVGNIINYKISDPNSPGVQKTISYDKSSGTFSGLNGYDTVRHDTTELPDQNRKWMEALLKGTAQPAGKEYLPVWRGNNDMPLKEEQYRQERQSGKGSHMVEPPSPSPGVSKGISALKTDEVGGVRLYFDPIIVDDVQNADARWNMIGELTDRIIKGEDNFFTRECSTRKLTAISLRTVLKNDGADADLGGLTRVVGFARNHRTGDVYLLGESDAGIPAIPLDVLTVALKLMWQGKVIPAISLDPDPDDFFGPQHVRLEDFPKEYRNTEFARIMLDADYEMKRITLGDDTLDIDGFASFAQIALRNPERLSGEYSRFWLCPRETTGAAVFHITRSDMEMYLYDSDVKVLTETMKRANAGLVSTGTRDIVGETASNAFTQYYSKIEQQRPIFRQLHGLFDVAKLAAILRSENASDTILDEIAQRQVKQVPVKDSYMGIGPKIITSGTDAASTFIFIGGGVLTSNALRSGDFVHVGDGEAVPDLEKLAGSGGNSSVIDASMPSVVPLDPKNAQLVDGDAEAFRGMDEVIAGDFKEAIDRMDQVLKQEPTYVKARTVRATANMMLGNFPDALKDIDIAVIGEPWLRGYRGRIRVSAGDVSGGLADVQAASIQFPDNPEVLMQKTWVDTECLQLSDARKDFQALRAMLPFDAEINVLGNKLRLLSRMSHDQAQEFLRAQASIPLAVSVPITRALALSKQGRLSEASNLLKQVINSTPGKVGQKDPLYIKERCWLLLAVMDYTGGTTEDANEAGNYVNMLRQQQPNWPSPLYYRAELDKSMTYAQTAELYLKAAKMSDSDDPFVTEALINNGVNFKAQVGFELSMAGAKQIDSDQGHSLELVYSVIDQAIASSPQGPAKYVLSLIKRSLGIYAQELNGKKFSAAETKRFDTEFNAALLNLPPVPAGADGTNLLGLNMLISTALQHQCDSAKTSSEVSDAGKLFAVIVKGLDSNWASVATLDQAAQQIGPVHALYASMLINQIIKDEQYTALKTDYDKGNLDDAGFLEGLDHVAEPMADNQTGVSPFSRAILRGDLYTRYVELFPKKDMVGLAGAICTRLSRMADAVEGSAHGLVELKAGKIWFSDAESQLLPHIQDEALRHQIISDFHRRASRLDQRFALEAALN